MQQRGYICENGRTQGNLQWISNELVYGLSNSLLFIRVLFRIIPGNIEDFVILFNCIYWHGHIVVGGHNLQTN